MRRSIRTLSTLSVLPLLIPSIGAARSQQTAPPAQAAAPPSARVPFTLDHNRMIVEVEFVRPDGSVRRASAWVDTGNQFLIMGEPLARDLGLDLSALEADDSGHSVELSSPAPAMRLAGLPLNVEGIGVRVHPGAHVRPGVPAEAGLPASALRNDHVVFDYPAGRLTVARPGVLEPRGVAIPCRVNADTGLFMIDATLDGENLALGVDNGSAGTWVSKTLTGAWEARHADWARATGAVGSANFFGFPFETEGVLMLLPELRLGSLRASNVALLGLDQTLFDWYSKKSAGPVVGFIGANVLKGFRLEVDFPNRMTYWEAGPASEAKDLDIVGLTLRPEADGRLTIAGVSTRAGVRTVEGVEPGATLLRVGALEVAEATMGAVIDALRGQPGETRLLVVEQGGERHAVDAMVTRFP